MKKWMTIFIVAVFVFTSFINTYGVVDVQNHVGLLEDEGCSDCVLRLSYQIGSTAYWVDDVENGPMESAPMIRHDRTFILVRYVVESLPGTSIGWDGTERKVTINTADGKVIDLWIDNHIAEVDGEEIQIDPNNPDVKPFIDGGRTFLPFRFIGEQLGTCDIKWYGDTRTVELIFNVDGCCEWTEIGDFEKVTDENGNLSIKFYEGCGKESVAFAVADKELEAVNAADFEDGGSYTLEKYEGECIKLCLDDNNGIVKWEAIPEGECCPDIFGDCCDWSVEYNEEDFAVCAGTTEKFPIIVKNNCEEGLIKLYLSSLYPEDEHLNQSIRLSAGETKTILIPVIMPEDCEPGKSISKGFKIISKCGDEEKFVKINAECIDCSCCEFETEFLEVPKTICAGDEFDLKLRVKNTCANNELKFKVEKSENSQGEIAPKYEESDAEFSVLAGQNNDSYFKCKMPEDCLEGEDVVFSLEVTAYDKDGKVCGKKLQELSVECVKCEVCCDFSVTYGRIPPPVYAGESFQLGLYLKNLCDEDDLTFVMTDISEESEEGCIGTIYEIKPNDVTVSPGRTEMIKTQNTMPKDCEGGGKCVFKVKIDAYTADGQLCGSKTLEYRVECRICCEFEYELDPVAESYCAGEEFSLNLKVKNICSDNSLSFKFDIAGGDWSNITEILPATFELAPDEEKTVRIDYKMPDDCIEGEDERFSALLTATVNGSNSSCEDWIDFYATCKSCEVESCCDVSFTSKLKMIPTSCPGESGSYQMVVKNNCTDELKTINFFWADNSGITSMSHKMLTLEPGEMTTVVVNFTMPDDCEAGEGNDFHFMAYVNDCPNLAGKFTVVCQDCASCCDVVINPKYRLAISACTGEEGSYVMVITNNCDDEVKNIEMVWSRSSAITTISPSSFTLKPGESKDITCRFVMPDCVIGKATKIEFEAVVNDCENVSGYFTVTCKDCSCCEVSFAPKLRIMPSYCPGETGSYQLVVTNDCVSQVKELSFTWSRSSGITNIEPAKLSLKPGTSQTIVVQFTMPDCTVGKTHSFSFAADVNDCDPLTVKFSVTCRACTCCEIEAIKQVVPESVAAGKTGTAKYYLKNNCDEAVTVILDSVSGTMSIKPITLTIKPGEKQLITISFKMPTNLGIVKLKSATFKFKIKVPDCDDQEVSFTVKFS